MENIHIMLQHTQPPLPRLCSTLSSCSRLLSCSYDDGLGALDCCHVRMRYHHALHYYHALDYHYALMMTV